MKAKILKSSSFIENSKQLLSEIVSKNDANRIQLVFTTLVVKEFIYGNQYWLAVTNAIDQLVGSDQYWSGATN